MPLPDVGRMTVRMLSARVDAFMVTGATFLTYGMLGFQHSDVIAILNVRARPISGLRVKFRVAFSSELDLQLKVMSLLLQGQISQTRDTNQ